MILIPGLRLGRGLNDRLHWAKRNRKNKAEMVEVFYATRGVARPDLPCVVMITRVAPGNGLDTDNLAGSCKAVRDQIAAWLGVDDKHRDIVRYEYDQRRGPWAVEISWRPLQDTAQVR